MKFFIFLDIYVDIYLIIFVMDFFCGQLICLISMYFIYPKNFRNYLGFELN